MAVGLDPLVCVSVVVADGGDILDDAAVVSLGVYWPRVRTTRRETEAIRAIYTVGELERI